MIYKNKKHPENWVDYNQLVYVGKRGIDWKKSYGCKIPFSYNGIIGEMTVREKDYSNKDRIFIEYNNQKNSISTTALKEVNIASILGFKSYIHKYKVGDIIECKFGTLRVNKLIYITQSNGHKTRGYDVTCIICGNRFDISETHLNANCGCGVCSNHKGLDGYNMIADTNPEFAKYLMNPEDAHKYKMQSNHKIDWNCQCCGDPIYGRSPAQVKARNEVLCNNCNKKSSYPNRLMFSLLTELNEDFKDEHRFDWCKFQAFNSNNMSFGKYDFVIENKKLIIEMDGELGHGNEGFNGFRKFISAEESQYRDNMKDKLAIEHGYKVIRISCNYKLINTRLEIIKNNIICSELSNIYDLSCINWNKLDSQCFSVLAKQNYDINLICEYWNYGWSTRDIANKFKLDLSTVIDYLQAGCKKNICNYNKSESSRRKSLLVDEKLGVNNFYKEDDTYRKTRFQLRVEIISQLYNNNHFESKNAFYRYIEGVYNISPNTTRDYLKRAYEWNLISEVAS